MGLLDILNGMANGPRGGSDRNGQGGMSPMTMAVLALLAYKGYKHFSQQQPQPLPDRGPQSGDSTAAQTGGPGGLGGALGGLFGGNAGGTGGIADILKGGLGGLLTGGAAGSLLSGGLGDLVRQLQQNGHSEAADSWVSRGPNKQIAPGELANALGSEDIDYLSQQSGLPREELLAGLSRQLPDVVDQLTPDGRLPDEHEQARRA
jgi:uncharacterized protein YidB (DUF937 family)